MQQSETIIHQLLNTICDGLFLLSLQEPYVCQSKDVGEQVELSIDLFFKGKTANKKVKYEWWVDDKRIKEGDRYKISDTGVLSIEEFEKSYGGNYKCILSTTNEPVMSVSAHMQLKMTGKQTYTYIIITM